MPALAAEDINEQLRVDHYEARHSAPGLGDPRPHVALVLHVEDALKTEQRVDLAGSRSRRYASSASCTSWGKPRRPRLRATTQGVMLRIGDLTVGRMHVDGCRSFAQPYSDGTKPAGAEIKDASGSRVPPLAKACTDAGSLCPSCRLFGCADTREDDAQRPSHADQQSYRGHVRFSDAVAEGEVTGLVMTLPPMGAPHPGASQFYLDATEGMSGNGALPPLREWGSAADRYGARRLRGRKFYWHTSVDDGPLPHRGAAREHHKAEEHEKTVTEAAAFPLGTVFTATVSVVDVTMDQIGALLATLRPELILSDLGGEDRDLVVHIGGGRPLGYGSCTIILDPDRTRLWNSAVRYGGAGEECDLDTIAEFAVEEFRESTKEPIARQWELIAKALTLDHVDPTSVWYPPGAHWTDREADPEKFDAGYAFWRGTSGLALAEQEGQRVGLPLALLPHIDGQQSMPIVRDVDIKDPKGKRLPGRKP